MRGIRGSRKRWHGFVHEKHSDWLHLCEDGSRNRYQPGNEKRKGFLVNCMIVGVHFIVTASINQAISVWAVSSVGLRTMTTG